MAGSHGGLRRLEAVRSGVRPEDRPFARRGRRYHGRSEWREIEHSFQTYKLLEDKEVEVHGWREREAALKLLAADRRRWEVESTR